MPGRAAGRAAPPLPAGQVAVERYSPLEVALRVTAPMPSFLVITDTFYPGWHAYVDGDERRILRGDLLFRVVEVPGGDHRVAFRFEPHSVLLGLAISLVALVPMVGGLMLTLRRLRDQRALSSRPFAPADDAG